MTCTKIPANHNDGSKLKASLWPANQNIISCNNINADDVSSLQIDFTGAVGEAQLKVEVAPTIAGISHKLLSFKVKALTGAFIYTNKNDQLIRAEDWTGGNSTVGYPRGIALILEGGFKRLVYIPSNITPSEPDNFLNQNQLSFGSNVAISSVTKNESISDEEWRLVKTHSEAITMLNGKENNDILRSSYFSYSLGEHDKGNRFYRVLTRFIQNIYVGYDIHMTEKGKWYIPAYGEIQKVAENIESINECLTAIGSPKYPLLNKPGADFVICSSNRSDADRYSLLAFKNLTEYKYQRKENGAYTIPMALLTI